MGYLGNKVCMRFDTIPFSILSSCTVKEITPLNFLFGALCITGVDIN